MFKFLCMSNYISLEQLKKAEGAVSPTGYIPTLFWPWLDHWLPHPHLGCAALYAKGRHGPAKWKRDLGGVREVVMAW